MSTYHVRGEAIDFGPDVSDEAYAAAAKKLMDGYRHLGARWRSYTDHHTPENILMAPPNPYRREPARDGMDWRWNTIASVSRPEHGLDVGLIDELLDRRWHEGHAEGQRVGREQAEARYEHVHDEGFEAGTHDLRRRIADRFGQRLHAAHELAGIADALDLDQDPTAGMPDQIDALKSAVRVIGGVLEQVIDDFNADRPRDAPAIPINPPGGSAATMAALDGVALPKSAAKLDRWRRISHAKRYLRAWLGDDEGDGAKAPEEAEQPQEPSS